VHLKNDHVQGGVLRIVGGNSGDAKSAKVNCQTFKVMPWRSVVCLHRLYFGTGIPYVVKSDLQFTPIYKRGNSFTA